MNGEESRGPKQAAQPLDCSDCTLSIIRHLKAGWNFPPRTYRPHTRWWWPGSAVTMSGITWQLEQMREQGMGGVEIIAAWQMYAKGNIPYLSDEWLEMVKHAIRTARKLDMDVAVTFGPGWSFGGFWVPPEDRSKVLAPCWVDVKGPGTFDGDLPSYEPAERKHRWDLDHSFAADAPDENSVVAAVAGRLDGDRLDGESLTDLTDKLEGNRLRWKIPEGRWRIMAFRIKYTGQQNQAQSAHPENWVVDHMNKGAMQRYCDYLGGTFYEAFGDEFGKTVDSFFCDSFEIHPLPNTLLWSSDSLERFKGYKGYDLTLYLPAIWWDIGELTPKVRYDVNEFLHWLGLETMFKTFVGWCEEHGVEARIQPHYRFTHEMIQGAGATHRPETEVTTARFDVITDPRKCTASGARLYGREIMSAEAYTFIHLERYRTTLEELKIATDAFLRDGVTQFYNHGYFYSPEMQAVPSRDMPWANRISHWNTWWKYYHHLTSYISRCCFMLRQGRFVANVLVYTPQDTVWTRKALFGTDRRVMPYGALGKKLVANGYDFDLVNDDILQNRARIEDGRIKVRDLSYRVLVLPKILAVPVETLEFMRSFVRGGGIIVALDELPNSSVGLKDYKRDDEKVRRMVTELFGPDGKGRADPEGGGTYYIPDYEIIDIELNPTPHKDPFAPTPPLTPGQTRLLEILRQYVPPDFALEGDGQSDGLTFIRRRIGEIDVYFIANIQPRPSSLAVRFPIKDKHPETWDAKTGEIKPLYYYRVTGDGLEIPLDLAPFESTFILFLPGQREVQVTDTNLTEIREISRDGVTGVTTKNGTLKVTLIRRGESCTAETSVSDIPEPLEVSGTCRMVLEGDGFPRVEKGIDHLASWTDDPQTKHFSGTGRYELDFTLPDEYVRENLELILDLGTVGTVAEVMLNGRCIGVSWMQPYRLDVTSAVRKGANHLEILATNTLISRVSGMAKPPEVPGELVPHYGETSDVYEHGQALAQKERGYEPLPDSGLVGPVLIIPQRRVTIEL